MADNLVCEETSDSWIIDNDDEINCVDGFMNEIDYNHELFSKDDNFNDNGSIPKMGEDRIKEMMKREIEFLPGTDYLKRLRSRDLEFRIRTTALDWILKVCAYYNFGPLCIYLSMNYLDRFLTSYELPKDKAWSVQLLAVSCLSLAAKMEETDVPQTVDFQVGDPSFVFEAKTIKRMELLVLNTLNWRLQALTPFSFVDYFIHKINAQISENLIYRFSKFILNTTKEIEFLDFKSSEIAAAAAVFVSDVEKPISNLIYVKQERVKLCLNLMKNLTDEENVLGVRLSRRQPARMVPVSPVGVLEMTCLSYKSESCTNSSQSSPDKKRRRKQ